MVHYKSYPSMRALLSDLQRCSHLRSKAKYVVLISLAAVQGPSSFSLEVFCVAHYNMVARSSC